jgi:hypothetical protein
MTQAAHLLDVALQQDVAQLDEKLFLETLGAARPIAAHGASAGQRRRR